MWLTEYTADQMHNLRTRIKRRKEALRKTSNFSNEGSSKSSSSVEADWQFVNFNPCMYGPRKSIDNGEALANAIGGCIATSVGASLSGSLTNLHLQANSENGSSQTTLTSQTSNVSICSSVSSVPGSTEDFYEFPTSTNLKQIASPSSNSNSNSTCNPLVRSQQQHHKSNNNIHSHDLQHDPPASTSTPEAIRRERDGGLPCKRDSLQQQKYLRHSLNSQFDLLPNPIQVQGQQASPSTSKHYAARVEQHSKAKASSTDSVVVTVSKSNSILSTSSSSSSTTSVSTSSGFSSNPVSRSSSAKCTPPVAQSKFYIPSPSISAAPIPPPPPHHSNNHHHASRPPLPLPREAAFGLTRPHSWDADSTTGVIVINGREIVYAKKRKEGSGNGSSTNRHSAVAAASFSPLRSPDTSKSYLNSENFMDKRKRNSYHHPYDDPITTSGNNGNNINRKVPMRALVTESPAKHSRHQLVSPHVARIPHPPPMPSYSLEECIGWASKEDFPAPPPRQPKGRVSSRPPPPPPTKALSAFNSKVSAVGSLCLSLINHSNHSHACM